MSSHQPIPNYSNKEVDELFLSFNTDEDRKWSWMVLSKLRETFSKLDHFVTGGLDSTYIDIRIGNKGKNKKRGSPVFALNKESKANGGGACLYVRDGFTDIVPDGINWWIKQQDDNAEQVDAWLLSIQEKCKAEGITSIKNGNGFLPADYKKAEPADEKNVTQHATSGSGNNFSAALNTIFYGPPGTGKTYNTISEAIKIIEPELFHAIEQDKEKSKQEKRRELKEQYDAFCREEKIVMTTFHQSFSYEDFVEGIRADTNDGKLEYRVEPGILRKIADAASAKKESNFDQAYQLLREEIEGNGLVLKTLVHNKPFDLEISDRGNLVAIPKTKAKTRMAITKENLKQFIFGQDYADWKPYTSTIQKHLQEKHQLTINRNNSNYVLIIDEINRGNISNIFGELITLIEDSKRKGAEDGEGLTISLPYSKKQFSLPDNLYLIGTMNTADRSLTQIDTALRRRFHFREMMPEPELLQDSESLEDTKVEGVNLRKLLTRLNERIEALYDREHTLGHAFFIHLTSDSEISELRGVFENKIFPLLQEYFFEDWKKIQLILGKALVTEQPFNPKLFSERVDALTDTKSYSFNNDALDSPQTYINIYKQEAGTE